MPVFDLRRLRQLFKSAPQRPGDQAARPEGESIVAALKASVLFAPDFPQRSSVSIAAWAELSEDEREEAGKPSLQAIELARTEWSHLKKQVYRLGQLRYREAIPLLSHLWRHCALFPVWQEAGWALLAMDDAGAYDAIEALIEDHDYFSRRTIVRAIFHRDPLHAYDRLARFFAQNDIAANAIAESALELFVPSSFPAGGGCDWYEKEAPSWLEQDPRWLTLCAELCKDENHGKYASLVLSYAKPESALQALAAAQAKRTPAPVAVTQARGDLVARYWAGDHLGAWRDARAFPAIAGALREEIIALAHETMERVARNADLISERLQRAGWLSLSNMRTRPDAGDADRIATIEQMTSAPLPPSLFAFWRVVGGINWVWDYDQGDAPMIAGLPLAEIDTDALWVEPCGAIEQLCFEMWEDQKSVIHPDLIGPFSLDLAPDRLHKMNVSGGPPYAIELPFAGADPLFRQEETKLPFVDYLRDCFNWAGFPYLKHYKDRSAALQFVKVLGAGLEPF